MRLFGSILGRLLFFATAEGLRVEEVLLELLHRLEVVGDEHEEIFDSEVREAIDDAVFHGFIKQHSGYELPQNYAMFQSCSARDLRQRIT